MKSKSPFAIKSPLRIQVYGGDTYERPDTVITKTVGEQVGKAITGIADNAVDYMDNYKKPEPRKKVESINSVTQKKLIPVGGFSTAGKLSSKTSNKIQYIKTDRISEDEAWDKRNREIYPEGSRDKFNKDMRADPSYGKGGNTVKQNLTSTSIYGDGRLISQTPYSPTSMKGSPNKLIGDTMDPYGQINPGAVPPNQAQNDLGAQPIMGAQGSQPSARAIDMAAIGNPYATPGADFDPQSKMKAESIFGSPMQRQGLMNLGTPLHDAGHGEKQSHSHPSKTTTKMKPDGEYPGAKYVKGDLVDQDDLLDKTKLDVHTATSVQSDKKGTFIKEMPDSGPGSNIETDKGFGKKIRLGSMGRSSYTSNMKDQLDPNDFLFKNTPKK